MSELSHPAANERSTFEITVTAPARAIDLLAAETGLSRAELKRAMNSGACWLDRPGQGRKRLRRATTDLKPGDRLELFHDPRLLATEPPEATLIQDLRDYSVWFKPAGLVAQGSDWGDHLSLLRQVEKRLGPRPALPVHRIDREASGLVLVAHNRRAAGALSNLFASSQVTKGYRIEVRGDLMSHLGAEGVIERPLDGKPARTRWRAEAFDSEAQTTRVAVTIDTGRYHQIRRHFEAIGHPVMGDPRYGRGNKNREGMKLAAVSLAFTCPLSGKPREFRCDVGGG